MTGTFNPAMTNHTVIYRRPFASLMSSRHYIQMMPLSRISAIGLLAGRSCNELRPQPDIYVISVGRNDIGSDCRIAFCFSTGVIASDQTHHLEGWLFEGDPGVEPGNVARTWKVFVHTPLASIRLGRYITLPSLLFGLLHFDRIIRHDDTVLVNIAGDAFIVDFAFNG